MVKTSKLVKNWALLAKNKLVGTQEEIKRNNC